MLVLSEDYFLNVRSAFGSRYFDIDASFLIFRKYKKDFQYKTQKFFFKIILHPKNFPYICDGCPALHTRHPT